ncbi:MAG: hypothetical protein ACJ78Q_05615, partial [Chloroflexia bacterium]
TCPPEWKIADNPQLASKVSSLKAVAVVSASDVWAVGSMGRLEQERTLVEHWDGTGWTIVPGPGGPAGSASSLSGIAAVATNDIWAVGRYYVQSSSDPSHGLIEHWDGSRWAVVATPGLDLSAVAATSPTDVWAAGDQLFHYDGNAWTNTPSGTPTPTGGTYPSDYGGSIYGVAALPGNDVWVVGAVSTGPHDQIMTGGQWGDKSDPSDQLWSDRGNYSGVGQTLCAVAAIAHNDIWAVGGFSGQGTALGAFIMHRTDKWTEVIPSDPRFTGPPHPYLQGLGVVAPDDIWAVGSLGNRRNAGSGTLAVHYDGSAWNVVSSPDAPECDCGGLYAVAAASPGDVWAVGDYYVGEEPHALIEHLDHAVSEPSEPGGCSR